jgi:hypothetical protein
MDKMAKVGIIFLFTETALYETSKLQAAQESANLEYVLNIDKCKNNVKCKTSPYSVGNRILSYST